MSPVGEDLFSLTLLLDHRIRMMPSYFGGSICRAPKRRAVYCVQKRLADFSKFFLVVFILLIPSCAFGWIIVEDKIFIERGDNLWNISYHIYGSGWYYGRLWRNRLDSTLTNDPNLIYAGMKFKYKTEPLGDDRPNGILKEINKKLGVSIAFSDSINRNIKSIEKSFEESSKTFTVKDILYQIVFTFLISVGSGWAVWLITEKWKS
jgi:hypothetical protein